MATKQMPKNGQTAQMATNGQTDVQMLFKGWKNGGNLLLSQPPTPQTNKNEDRKKYEEYWQAYLAAQNIFLVASSLTRALANQAWHTQHVVTLNGEGVKEYRYVNPTGVYVVHNTLAIISGFMHSGLGKPEIRKRMLELMHDLAGKGYGAIYSERSKAQRNSIQESAKSFRIPDSEMDKATGLVRAWDAYVSLFCIRLSGLDISLYPSSFLEPEKFQSKYDFKRAIDEAKANGWKKKAELPLKEDAKNTPSIFRQRAPEIWHDWMTELASHVLNNYSAVFDAWGEWYLSQESRAVYDHATQKDELHGATAIQFGGHEFIFPTPSYVPELLKRLNDILSVADVVFSFMEKEKEK